MSYYLTRRNKLYFPLVNFIFSSSIYPKNLNFKEKYVIRTKLLAVVLKIYKKFFTLISSLSLTWSNIFVSIFSLLIVFHIFLLMWYLRTWLENVCRNEILAFLVLPYLKVFISGISESHGKFYPSYSWWWHFFILQIPCVYE